MSFRSAFIFCVLSHLKTAVCAAKAFPAVLRFAFGFIFKKAVLPQSFSTKSLLVSNHFSHSSPESFPSAKAVNIFINS